MQGSELFNKAIASHLQSLADNDPLFAITLKKPNKNIDDCVKYILNTVHKSGKNGLADEEVYAMAIHYYDEDDIKLNGSIKGRVVVNHKAEHAKKSVAEPIDNKIAKKGPKKQPIINQPSLF